MLFSQPEVASFLSDSFECAWESVRPVPRITIDFGNGHTLERTLRGNIATYVCTSAGETIDLVPGLVDGGEYVTRLQQSLMLFQTVRARSAEPLRELLARWHGLRSVPLGQVLSTSEFGVPLESGVEPIRTGISKFKVERPLENGLASARSGLDDSGLARDTEFAREQGYRLAHAFLSSRRPRRPAALSREVYRELLHVDLEDPYLGLAPEVLGGEPGRN